MLDWVPHEKVVKVTKVISKSYPINQVCTNGRGKNFLKCGVLRNDPRKVCKTHKINKRTKCLKGFKPMGK